MQSSIGLVLDGDGVRRGHADGGELLELFDLTAGQHGHLLGALRAMHLEQFPEHAYAAEEFEHDFAADPHREGIVVHQWVLCVDGHPVAYSLADSNLIRRVAPMHFLAVAPQARDITVGGRRLGTWFLADTNRQLIEDVGGTALGSVAETPSYKLPAFLPQGWQILDPGYPEPVHGWKWPTAGLEIRRIVLLWLPIEVAPIRTKREVRPAAAAAFLLDMYGVDAADPVFAPLLGAEGQRGGVVRRSAAPLS